MNISFKNKADETKFKKFTCENKEVLLAFFAFGESFKNPISKLIFKGLAMAVKIICPK